MPLPAKNDPITQQRKLQPSADSVSDKAIALKPPAQLSTAEKAAEMPPAGEYVIGPFQSTLQRKLHEEAPSHVLFSPLAGGGVAQRVLTVKDDEKDDEWVDELDADNFDTVQHIDAVEFDDVKALLKVWISLDRDVPYAGAHAAVTAAVADLRASADINFGELTGAGFSADECRNMYSILGGTLTDIMDQFGGAGLKSIYDEIDLNGTIMLHDAINDAAVFCELVVSELDDNLMAHISELGGKQAGTLIGGSSIAKFRKLCDALTADHVNAIATYPGCYALMEWTTAELTALNANWINLGRLLSDDGADVANEVAQIAALRALGPTMANIAGFATFKIFNADDLLYLFNRCNDVGRLNGILATAVTGYGQDRNQVRSFLNANPNVAPLATLENRLETLIKGRPTLTGAEIEKMHNDGTVAINYVNTIQTAQEQQEGGGTHVFSIAWGGMVRSHEIHIHYEKGQNRKTQNVAKHIKPSAFSLIRNPITHDFALALQATIP